MESKRDRRFKMDCLLPTYPDRLWLPREPLSFSMFDSFGTGRRANMRIRHDTT
jgi:hypothetical protein